MMKIIMARKSSMRKLDGEIVIGLTSRREIRYSQGKVASVNDVDERSDGLVNTGVPRRRHRRVYTSGYSGQN